MKTTKQELRNLPLTEPGPTGTRLINDRELADNLGMSVATVRRWRLLRQGPPYIKVGSSVRYRPNDVEAWLHCQPNGGAQLEVQQ